MGVCFKYCLPLAFLVFLLPVALADGCQPYTWGLSVLQGGGIKTIQVGELDCRFTTRTGAEVTTQTCTQIAERYETTVDKFLDLNPELNNDCGSIKPKTEYCVIVCELSNVFKVDATKYTYLQYTVVDHEPLRAWDGLCGPNHGDATCIGTPKQCCNSTTWTCGDTEYVWPS